MVASFTDWDRDPNYLAHFGIKGMKHGVRRFQNSDGSLTALGRQRYGYTDTGTGGRNARGVARDLNKLDREKTTSKYRMEKYAGKIAKKDARYAAKMEAAKAAGNTKKFAKIAEKQRALVKSKAASKVKGYRNLINRDDAMANRIIKSAKANGMEVSSKQTKRIVNKGALAAKAALGLGAAYGVGSAIGSHYAKNPDFNVSPTLVRKNGRLVRGITISKSVNVGKANMLARAAGGAIGVGVGATAKLRTGTKYKVKNKYRSR